MKRTSQPTAAAVVKPLQAPKTNRWNLFYAYTAGTVMGLMFYHLMLHGIDKIAIGMSIFSTVGVILAVQTDKENRDLLLHPRTDKFRKN